jgi:hypothetical protein
VIVSRNSQTPAVLQSFGQAFAGIIGAAVQPVTGGGYGGFGLGGYGAATAPLPTIGGYSSVFH